MAEKNNKRSSGLKQFPIETKRAVLFYFSRFDSRDMDFPVYINRHENQSVFGSRRKNSTDEEIRLRKQVNDYKLKLGKNTEFLHLELARNGFDTVSGRPLTLHPQLKKKVDDEHKLKDALPVSEPRTSPSTQQTPDDSHTMVLSDMQQDISTEVTFHVVGDAYVDLFSFLEGNWPESGGDSHLEQPVKFYAGGSAVNTSTHLKALIRNFAAVEPKPNVILHTVLNPDDQYGKILLNHADEHDIPIENYRKENVNLSTGHCIAIVSGGERSFMTHQGVVKSFGADQLDVGKIVSTPTHLHIHIAGYYNMPGFWNGKLKRKLEVIREQRRRMYPDRNITISLVTQYDATGVWDGGLTDLFPLLDFVLMNELEARSIIRCGCESHNLTEFEQEYMKWADYFGRQHPTINVIVTRGEKGAVILCGKRIVSKQKPIVMNSIDPTGAGDSFTAGFIYGIWSWKLITQQKTGNNKESWPTKAIEEGMRWGVSLASATIMIRGASVPPGSAEIKRIYQQAKEPEHLVML